jgi:hypothetical protein
MSKSKLCCDRRSVDQFFYFFLSLFLGSYGFVDVGRPLWREVGSAVFSFCWASPAQLLIPRDSRAYFIVSDFLTPQPGGPGSCIYFPQEQGSPVIPPGVTTHVEVKVNLPPKVSRPVCLDARLPTGAHDQILFLSDDCRVSWCGVPFQTRGWAYNLLVQLLLGLARAVTLIWDSPNMEDKVPVFT